MTVRARSRPRVVIAIALAAILVSVVVVGLYLVGPAGGAPVTALGPPRFVEVSDTAGIDQRYADGTLFYVGGGVATFDCDDDHRPELFIAGGSAPAAMFRNDSPTGGPIRFQRLDRPDLALTDVTGAYPLDIDSDGITDLVVLRTMGNVLFRGLGACVFEPADDWGLDGGNAWTNAFSATWEAGSAWPTLAFGNYLPVTNGEPELGACADNVLVRPTPGAPPYGISTPLRPSYCTLSLLFSDWSRTGRRDLRVSNDRHYYSDYSDGQEQLWRMSPGAEPEQYTSDDGWQRLRIEGMGIASQDVTGDGLPEVYLTSQAENRLETLAGGVDRPTYRNTAYESGVESAQPSTGGDHMPSTAWHPQFEDVNADGLMDVFLTKGNVTADPEFAMRDPNELFLGQADGTFQVATETSGILDMTGSRGASLADLDLDGLLDLVVVERDAPVRVWRNLGAGDAAHALPMGHRLGIELSQEGTNRDAIGAWVEVRANGRTIARERTVGGGHASGQLGPLHVGLGSATSAEVRVQWPDGEWGPWMPVDADRSVRIDRGETEPIPIMP